VAAVRVSRTRLLRPRPSTHSQILGVVERDGSGPDFYAQLYTALFYEAHGTLDEPRAREWMVSATNTPYAKLAGDYMADLARVHVQRRGWAPSA